MDLVLHDLVRYCNRHKVPQPKFEAAEDYLKDLIKDPEASPSLPLRRFFDKALITKVEDLAKEFALQEQTGFDRLERTLVSHASTECWTEVELEAGLEYLRGLRVDQRQRYSLSIDQEQADFIKELSREYGNVFA